jgi:hypothetical protein
MPHFFAQAIKSFEPKGSFVFASSNGKEHLIGVEVAGEEFLLSQRPKGDRHLVKYDKVTRLSNLTLLKQTLNEYATTYANNVVTSNIATNRIETQSECVKEIEDFIGFASNQEIYVEIGFGSGRHLLHQASTHPNVLMIGLEIYKPSIVQVDKQIRLQALNNVMLLDYDARLFLELLDSNTISKIFVHFEALFVGDNVALIKVALGDVSRPEHKYIIIRDEKARYYQSIPVPTRSNHLAHQMIVKRVSG